MDRLKLLLVFVLLMVGDTASKETICREEDMMKEILKKKPEYKQSNQVTPRSIIKWLWNCTEYHGNIVIDGNAAKDDKFEEYVRNEDLYRLRNLRIIRGYVYLSLSKYPEVRSLYFLQHLREILTTDRRGFTVKSSLLDSLDFGDLRLDVPYVGIINNTELCYLENIKTINPSIRFEVKGNSDPAECDRIARACSPKCNPKKGCWGPNERNCFECREWKAGGSCVRSCDSKVVYYVPRKGRICGECHEKCKYGCFGPSADQCYAPPDPNYFCPKYMYFDGVEKVCKECSLACFGASYKVRKRLIFRACTGPQGATGPKGCTVKCPATTFLSITKDGLFRCALCPKHCIFGCRNGTLQGCLKENDPGSRRIFTYEREVQIPTYVVWILGAIALCILGVILAILRCGPKRSKGKAAKYSNLKLQSPFTLQKKLST